MLVRVWSIFESSLSRSYINRIGAIDDAVLGDFFVLVLGNKRQMFGSTPFSKEEIEEVVFNLEGILLIIKKEIRWFFFRVYSGFVRSGSHKVMEECWH